MGRGGHGLWIRVRTRNGLVIARALGNPETPEQRHHYQIQYVREGERCHQRAAHEQDREGCHNNAASNRPGREPHMCRAQLPIVDLALLCMAMFVGGLASGFDRVVPLLRRRDGAVPPRRRPSIQCSIPLHKSMETQMYIGGGILGTLLLVVLIVYLARRI